MTDPIEEMKKAGWILGETSKQIMGDSEFLTFHRPIQKPNAIVDWDEMDRVLCRNFSEEGIVIIRNLIKRA